MRFMIFDVGDRAYFLEDLVNPKAVTIKERSGNMYTVELEDSETLRLRQTRLFATLEEAKRNSIRLLDPEAEQEKRAAGVRRTSRLPQDFGLKIWRSGKGVRS